MAYKTYLVYTSFFFIFYYGTLPAEEERRRFEGRRTSDPFFSEFDAPLLWSPEPQNKIK